MIDEAHWTHGLFGNVKPDEVRRRIGQALRDMNDNARNSQAGAGVKRRSPYGAARYTNCHERLHEQFDKVKGAYRIKPGNRFGYDLVVVGKALLYPFCFAKKDQDIHTAKIPNVHPGIVQLFEFAPDPPPVVDLFGEHRFDLGVAEPSRLGTLPEDTQLVLIPFACNDSGLLKPYWGIAALADDTGTLAWITDPEALPTPATATPRNLSLVSPQAPAPDLISFDAGAEPVANMSPKPDDAAEEGPFGS